MKKLLVFFAILVLPLITLACSSVPTLNVLNWGEYINQDVVDAFEEQYGVRVRISIASSNELMEQRIKAGTTSYDIVVPSDYMIEKLYDEGYLQKIDLSKLTNFDEDNFLVGVNEIMGQLLVDNDDVASAYEVAIPYFWGVFGIMYNNSIEGLKEYIEANEWKAVFETEPSGTFTSPLRVGMYDVPRFAYSSSMLYANQIGTLNDATALNTESQTFLQTAENILKQRTYASFQTDSLKKDIELGELDIAFTYVGDFFDTFLIVTEDETTEAGAIEAASHIGVFVPQNTIAFLDGMVIPADAKNVELAHQFIDWFLDPDNAYENSGIVGYTTSLQEVYDTIYSAGKGDIVRSIMVRNYPYNPEGSSAKPLLPFSDNFTNDITTMLSRVKAN
jgi:spermidine/putrescine transport system substrate-binding protein/spermidine/putrescine transport system permease protein